MRAASLFAWVSACVLGSYPLAALTAPASEDPGALAQVIVTAQRRSENVQQVPIAVGVLKGTDAERFGIAGTDTLQLAVPGLILNRQSGSGGAPFLRGIGTNSGVAGAELPVAMYIDDVYLASPLATIFPFADIEQVEVLKGPQGTLFGRNATGGVVHVRTRRPSREPGVTATLGYGNFRAADASLYATGPVGDSMAVNFSAIGHRQYAGYGRNVTRNEHTYRGWHGGFRSSLSWQPNERRFVLVSADYSELESDTGGRTIPYPGTVSAGQARNIGRFTSSSGASINSEFAYTGASVRVEQEFDALKLVSITADRATRQHGLYDQDLGAANLVANDTRSRTENFSQEIQLHAGHEESWRGVLGVFYFNSKACFRPLRTLGLSQGANGSVDLRDCQHLHSYSAFADARLEILDAIGLTLGIRYTRDDYDLDVEPRVNAAGSVLIPGFSTDDSFSKPTYRAILDHKVGANVLGYISFSRGYKSGGYNVSTPGNPPAGLPPVSPEVLDATEIGLKSEWLQGRLRINASAFHYDYENVQVNIVLPPAVLVNAGKATLNGADLELALAATDRLTLSFAGSWLDGDYTNFNRGPLYVPNPGVCAPAPMSLDRASGGNTQCAADLAGNETIRSPHFTGNIAARYDISTSRGELSASALLYGNSGFFWEPDNRIRQHSYRLLNASLTWAPSRHYTVQLWSKNLLNEYYYYYGAESPLADQVTPAAPRTYGISFSALY